MFWRIILTPAILAGNKIYRTIRDYRLGHHNLIGNKASKVYHRRTCPRVELVEEKNRRIFEKLKDVPLNYRPCEVCQPPLLQGRRIKKKNEKQN